MAKYGINETGAKEMHQLSKKLQKFSADMNETQKTLKKAVENEHSELGIYYSELIQFVDEVEQLRKKGDDCMMHLAQIADKSAKKIESLIAMGIIKG